MASTVTSLVTPTLSEPTEQSSGLHGDFIGAVCGCMHVDLTMLSEYQELDTGSSNTFFFLCIIYVESLAL